MGQCQCRSLTRKNLIRKEDFLQSRIFHVEKVMKRVVRGWSAQLRLYLELNWSWAYPSNRNGPSFAGKPAGCRKGQESAAAFSFVDSFFSFALASLVYKNQRFSRCDMFGPLLTAQKSLKRASSILFHLFAFCRENYDSTCQLMPIVCGQSG